MLMLDILRHNQKSAPVDVSSIARGLGLKIEETADCANLGAALRLNGSKRILQVNAFDGRRRKRFAVAHEMAHFILHRDLIGGGITEDRAFRGLMGAAEETQANRLAADILLPKHLIDRYWVRENKPDTAALSAAFDVSEEAMRIRLRVLGFIPAASSP